MTLQRELVLSNLVSLAAINRIVACMVGRLIGIIQHLARSEGRTLADLARATGLPKSSLHRMLHLLIKNEAVTRHGNTYRLSDSLVGLVGAPLGAPLSRLLTPNLVDLHLRTGLVASLAVLHQSEAVFVQTIFTHRNRALMHQVPNRAPAHCTAAGKLLLALHPGELAGYPRLAATTKSTIIDRAALERELARIRADGIAISHGEYVDGMVGIAAPVVGRRGRTVAALAAGGPADHTDILETATLLRQSAHTASLAMRRGF